MSRPILAALVALSLLAAACTSSPSSSSPTTSSSTKTTTTVSVPPPVISSQTTIINGITVTVPRETASRPIDPSNDTGGQVIISDKGLLPFHLFVALHQPITWTNLTPKPVSITFLHFAVASGPIQPGKSFTWTPPTGISIRYTSSNGFVGTFDVGAFQ